MKYTIKELIKTLKEFSTDREPRYRGDNGAKYVEPEQQVYLNVRISATKYINVPLDIQYFGRGLTDIEPKGETKFMFHLDLSDAIKDSTKKRGSK